MYYENRKNDIQIASNLDGSRRLQWRLHLHYHVEVVYMKEGSSTAIVDGREYTLSPDSLLVVFPNKPHAYISTEMERYVLAIISPNIMPEVVNLFDSYEPKTPVLENVSSFPRLVATIEVLSELSKSMGTRNDVIKRGYAAALMGMILKYLPTEKTDVECSRAMRAVIDYCVRNYNRELSLGLLSEELHMSRYYISHLFSKEFNMKFNDYINSLRVSAACRLLCDTSKSITEISEEVGFATARTFNRAFNKQYRLSPSEYRQASRGQTE